MARRPRRAAGGEEFIRGLVQSNSFVIAKVCTEKPRGLSVGSASEFFLAGSVTRRSRPGDDVSHGTERLLSANLRSFRVYVSQQSEGAFLPPPSFERQVEALACLFNIRFRNRGEVQRDAISQMPGHQLGLPCRLRL
jgi:hypothetical protein